MATTVVTPSPVGVPATVSPTATPTPGAPAVTTTAVTPVVREGIIKEVRSADTFVIGHEGTDILFSLQSLSAPRLAVKSASNETADQAFAWEAREGVRKWLIGKEVEFITEAITNGREYGEITFQNESVSQEVVRRGYAQVRGRATVLKELESEASRAFLGLWHPCTAHYVRSMTFIRTLEQGQAAMKELQGKRVPALIEYCRDGGNFTVFIPSLVASAPVTLTGVRVDGFRKNEAPDMCAEVAKAFAEQRVLQRDNVQVRVEGVEDSGILVVSVFVEGLDLALYALQHGWARLNENTLSMVEKPAAFRAAQSSAQAAQKGRWATWKSSVAQLASNAIEGTVTEVLSPDTLLVLDEKTGVEQRVLLAHLKAPRCSTRARAAEPFADDGKEFVRTRLIGRKVVCEIVYTRKPNTEKKGEEAAESSNTNKETLLFAIVHTPTGENLNALLLTEGFARLAPPARDEAADCYDDLVAAEREATDKKKRLHGSAAVAEKSLWRLNDLTGVANASRAKAFERELVGQKVDGVVEFVMNSTRFRVRLPSQNLLVTAALSHVRSIRDNDDKLDETVRKIARDATATVRKQLLQRNVVFEVESIDKSGTLLGSITVRTAGTAPKKAPLAVELLEKGLVTLTMRRDTPAALRDADAAGRSANAGFYAFEHLFAAPVEEKKDEDKEEDIPVNALTKVGQVYISSVRSVAEFAYHTDVQAYDDMANDIEAIHKTATMLERPPKRDDVVLCLDDDDFLYRVKIIRENRRQETFTVLRLDVGGTLDIEADCFRVLPAHLSLEKRPALAKTVKLAGLLPKRAGDDEDLATYLEDAGASDQPFECYAAGKDAVVLFPVGKTDVADSINAALAKEGLALVDKTHFLCSQLGCAPAQKMVAGKLSNWNVVADENAFPTL